MKGEKNGITIIDRGSAVNFWRYPCSTLGRMAFLWMGTFRNWLRTSDCFSGTFGHREAINIMEENPISLKEHIYSRLEELNRRIVLAFEGHQSVHSAEHEALEKAARDIRSRLEAMNEFRSQLLEERQNYVTRVLFDAEHNNLQSKLEARCNLNEQRISVLERAQSGAQGSMWMLGIVMTILGVLVGLFLRYLRL